ncbi:MAG: polyhydroxyalkanoate synthesis repressor PhaR [Magnetococcales bacterium]|nr:polyhydroxyalkanoate synthesis repressor PhaR [Magnetococcales bacterium]
MEQNSRTRLIKKYPNRRLYDQEASCFLTLDGVRKLVVEGMPFRVVDAKNGHDITRAILLQVLAEEEEKGVPIFSTNLLLMIIRLYGNHSQLDFSRFIERSFAFFLEQQGNLGAKLTQPLLNPVKPGVSIISTLTEMAEKNLALWQEWQRGIPSPLEMWSPGSTGDTQGLDVQPESEPVDPAARRLGEKEVSLEKEIGRRGLSESGG